MNINNSRAPARLAKAKKEAAAWAVRFPDSAHYTDWRNNRPRGIFGSANWSNAKNGRFHCDDKLVGGFRDAGKAADVLGRRYCGAYYADAFQDETYTARVWQLPARNGTPQYLAGYIESNSGCAVLGCDHETGALDIYDDKNDAARRADDMARDDAEKAQEEDERYQESARAEEEKDDAKTAIIGLLRDVKDQKKVGPLSPAMCRRVCDELSEKRDVWHAALSKWNELKEYA